MSANQKDAAWLGINQENLALRREFVGLGKEEQEILKPLIPWIGGRSKELANRFYEFQFNFAPTKSFFANYAKEEGRSMDDLRKRLEAAQATYLESVFSGSRTGWDLEYFEQRIHVGLVHDRINLPFKWYVGSYALWRELLEDALAEDYGSKSTRQAESEPTDNSSPVARLANKLGRHNNHAVGPDPEPAGPHPDDVLRAVDKVFNLDLQAIGDAFLMATIESFGLDVASVNVPTTQDRTEGLSQIKEDIRKVSEALPLLTVNITSIASAIEELAVTSREISSTTSEVSSMSDDSTQLVRSASEAIERLSDSSSRIDGVTAAIAKVAEQTNLLALNASIEAARAGEAGAGFAVVSNEVKGLAQQTASSTNNIEAHVKQITTQVDDAVESIASIVDNIASVGTAQTSVATATEQQVGAIREIENNAHEASKLADQIDAVLGNR